MSEKVCEVYAWKTCRGESPADTPFRYSGIVEYMCSDCAGYLSGDIDPIRIIWAKK